MGKKRIITTLNLFLVDLTFALFAIAGFVGGKEIENNFFKTKAVPKYVSVKWFENGTLYFGKTTFDKDEIFKAFNDMSTACPGEPLELYLKHDYSMRRMSVSLRSKTKEIEIEKTGKVGISMKQPKKES